MKTVKVKQAELRELLQAIPSPKRVTIQTRTKETKIFKEFGNVYRLANYVAVLNFQSDPETLENARKAGLTDEYFNKTPAWAQSTGNNPLLICPNNGQYYLQFLIVRPAGRTKTRWTDGKKTLKADYIYEIKRDSIPQDRRKKEDCQFLYITIKLESIVTIKIDNVVYQLMPGERIAKERAEKKEKTAKAKERKNKQAK